MDYQPGQLRALAAAGTVGTLNFYAGANAYRLVQNAAHITLTALNYLGGGTLSFSS